MPLRLQDCAGLPDRGAEDREEGAQAAAARRPVNGAVRCIVLDLWQAEGGGGADGDAAGR